MRNAYVHLSNILKCLLPSYLMNLKINEVSSLIEMKAYGNKFYLFFQEFAWQKHVYKQVSAEKIYFLFEKLRNFVLNQMWSHIKHPSLKFICNDLQTFA